MRQIRDRLTVPDRATLAVGRNPEAARSSGIGVERTWTLALLQSGALAGLAGPTAINPDVVVLLFDALEPVSAIEKKLVETRANQLAAQDGRQKLELLRQGKDAQVSWNAPQVVSRTDPKGLPPPILRQAFKADTAKLPSYTGTEAPNGGEPDSEDRKRILALLGPTPVGVTDDFFKLGGQSLLAVQVVARIEKIFGRRLPLAPRMALRDAARGLEIL